jgi:predicted lipid-binding transport protein (Tim44 family)
MDIYSLIFLALAVFIVYRLKATLGERTGYEQTREQLEARHRRHREEAAAKDITPAPENDSKIIPLPRRPDAPQQPETFSWKGMAEEGSDLAKGFDAVVNADSSFSPQTFLSGAKMAYEMVVEAYAEGDRKTLTNLLSREVFEGFQSAIVERESRSEQTQTKLIGFDEVRITEAAVKDKDIHITVHFVAKLITATRDADGVVVEGSPEKVVNAIDIWTFAKPANAKDPNWKLIATDSKPGE